MSERYEELMREVIRLVGDEKAPREEVLHKAREAKEEMIVRVMELSRATTSLDNLIAWFAPDVQWQFGWVSPTPGTVSVAPQRPSTPTRTQRVLEIAEGLAADGTTVSTREIAARLQAEGEQKSLKDLSTAVGNILTSSGRWVRVARGVYEVVKVA